VVSRMNYGPDDGTQNCIRRRKAGPQNKELKLTKPGELRSFAA